MASTGNPKILEKADTQAVHMLSQSTVSDTVTARVLQNMKGSGCCENYHLQEQPDKIHGESLLENDLNAYSKRVLFQSNIDIALDVKLLAFFTP